MKSVDAGPLIAQEAVLALAEGAALCLYGLNGSAGLQGKMAHHPVPGSWLLLDDR